MVDVTLCDRNDLLFQIRIINSELQMTILGGVVFELTFNYCLINLVVHFILLFLMVRFQLNVTPNLKLL